MKDVYKRQVTKLASLTLDGAATLNAGSIATTGGQRYKGAVTLGSDHTLSTTTGGVAFDAALDGARNLRVVSTAGGDVSFDAVGGATQRLGLSLIHISPRSKWPSP